MEKLKSLKGSKLAFLLCATLLVFCFACAASDGVNAASILDVNIVFDVGADFEATAQNVPGKAEPIKWAPGEQTVPSEKPTADGVTFLGWTYEGYEGTELIQPGDQFVFESGIGKPDESGATTFTFYAVWGVNVSYEANINDATATVTPDLSGKTFDAQYKIAYQTEKALTATDYTFIGWSLDAGTKADDTANIIEPEKEVPFEKVVSDFTLYGVWKANFLKVTYHANTGAEATDAGVTVPLDYNHYQAGNVVTVLGASTKNTVENTQTLSTQSVELNANDTTGSTDGNTNTNGNNNTDNNNTAAATATKTYTDANMVRTGYTFAGWATAPDSAVVAYKPGATFTINADTDLYAVWTNGAATEATTTTPQTGEEDNLLLYSVVAMIALLGIVYLCFDRRKVKAKK